MQNQKKYLIISDLDGTLLNSEGKLSPTTVSYIKELTAQGHIFCIATGRPLRGSIDIYRELGLDSIMVNYNGSYISNPSDPNFSPLDLTFSKEIAQDILKTEEVRSIISNAFLESKDSEIQLTKFEDESLRQDFLKFYHVDILDESMTNLENNPDNLKHDINALLLYVDDNNVDRFDSLMFWIKNVSPYLQVRMINLPHSGIMVEVNTMFADKSMGLNFLASYYGIPKDRILAFGDGDNDMRMLSEAKYGFAMKNGRDTAKMSARHITKFTNNEDGVAWEIKYFMNHIDKIN